MRARARACVCARARVQILGGFAEVVKNVEEVHTVMEKVLNHIHAQPEFLFSKIVVSVEANQPMVSDMVEQKALAWGRDRKRAVILHGDWVRLRKVDVTDAPSALLRAGATPGSGETTMERHQGRVTTNASKCTGALQLRNSLQLGAVRFSTQLKVESLDMLAPEATVITRFLDKMRTQLGSFIMTRTATGKVTVSGKGENHKKNDDIIMVAAPLNSMVAAEDAALVGLFRR